MTFTSFLEEKIGSIIFYLLFLFILFILLFLLNISLNIVILLEVILVIIFIVYLLIDYYRLKKKQLKIISLVDELDEKYLILNVLNKPKELGNQGFYYALQKSSKAMNDKINDILKEKQDYQEYIESFTHEIKTPIAAISLYCDNTNNYEIKEQLKKIEIAVEQVLYYARSENTEKDYFIKKIKIEDLIHPVILDYRYYFLKNKVSLNIHDVKNIVYTDEKWLNFIISQIIQNSLKYFDKEEKQIEIYSEDKENNVILYIKDNGMGISSSDLPRVFNKGFTGSNRNKEYATGIGLYLCKKLCDRMNLKIAITSKEKEYTIVSIAFPKGKVHQFNEE